MTAWKSSFEQLRDAVEAEREARRTGDRVALRKAVQQVDASLDPNDSGDEPDDDQ